MKIFFTFVIVIFSAIIGSESACGHLMWYPWGIQANYKYPRNLNFISTVKSDNIRESARNVVIRARYGGATYTGKYEMGDQHAYIPVGGNEVRVTDFEVIKC